MIEAENEEEKAKDERLKTGQQGKISEVKMPSMEMRSEKEMK